MALPIAKFDGRIVGADCLPWGSVVTQPSTSHRHHVVRAVRAARVCVCCLCYCEAFDKIATLSHNLVTTNGIVAHIADRASETAIFSEPQCSWPVAITTNITCAAGKCCHLQ